MATKILPLKPNGHDIYPSGYVRVEQFDSEPSQLPVLVSHMDECDWCGERVVLRIADDAVYADEPCPHSDGITTVITLNVPSGKIVVSDSLHPAYSVERGSLASFFESALGQAEFIEAMAAIGCAYGPVGNFGPGIYCTGGDSYIIASPEYGYGNNGKPSLRESDRLARISRQKSTYSIADYEDWQARSGNQDDLASSDIVEIPAGTYQFTHYLGECVAEGGTPGMIVFAQIAKIA